ncbi:prephenate dehydrogenase [Cytobacillus sp. IB215665]|uniref:prephenate dehydrogenase n=1 Tax=Cytobacillus sp. IB215665 TaxID=3097357 RepID=UPI002A125A6A|nr:prephenate dehydrogenase [Cytobacillus sp. IB215665]MDX8364858.1 prephenate dehydrogenase [Cytobacillus sp. IB215665]
MNKRVLIIGLGLIGGSIGLAISKAHKQTAIIGYDINTHNLKLAKTLGIIDEIAISLEQEVNSADLIILATPVRQTEILIEQMAQYKFKQSAIVTDVGSTKQFIVSKANIFRQKGVTFIGGHPMAGSHKSGVVAAKAHLFENAFYILTTPEDVGIEHVNDLKEWLKGTNAKFIHLSPQEHDRITGVISHFPHIIAASLVHQAETFQNEHEFISRLAAGGFKDITRIASSNPEMWRDILLHNKDELLHLFNHWTSEMETIRKMIDNEDGEGIFSYFSSAKRFRESLPAKAKGAIPSFYDLYVDVPDYPGIISEVTGYLALEKISITNIRIIEIREDIYGVLRLSFQSEEDRNKAVSCLAKHTSYDTYYG